ncbi:MAG: LysM peptidoglycan-binding domain-containing protein [Acidobacteria bacterium]|nr:LysM peptidoglycan-binding domain-containing protein [Acidobacteriota bacterium]
MNIKQSCLLRFAPIVVLVAALGCQTAKKPASVLPARQAATPPPIQPAPLASRKPSPKPSSAAVPLVPPAVIPAEIEVKAKPDPIQELLVRVEKEYGAADNDLKLGRNDSAQLHFEQAYNLLRQSPAATQSDARIQAEYDRVLERINTLESSRVEPGGAAGQKSEPAPIDEANEVTNYPVDPGLKAQAAAEIRSTQSDLPLMMTDQVAGYIDYFSSRGRGTLEHALERSGRYRTMIARILKEEGVPQDLVYLAQAESGFHPYAVSRAGARGIWQFMASRARAYDLHRDFWMDERQDPEKSTRAAARHLKDLYNEFGDWYLAMAAYNSGPGTVQNAVKRTGYADFWELYRRNVLPKETRNYVPIILAVTIMAKNPAQYGLDSIVPDTEITYDTVKINYAVDLRLAADCAGVSPAELEELNPALLRMITPKERFELHLPAGSRTKYESAIASIPPEMRLWWRYHQVVPGDTLMSIARFYHTSLQSIAEANQLEGGANIVAGGKLIIPLAPGRRASGDVQTFAKRLTIYHVRKGDTLQSVSENLGIPQSTILRWNRLPAAGLGSRRVLYVHLPVSPASVAAEPPIRSKSKASNYLSGQQSTPSRLRHTVKHGETLYSIAATYNTSVAAIKQTNAHLATLRPGMVLVIPASP